tara:strand:- start:23 stop:583 length:561 start_codon:yes stop_codon:yes gene_type:complete
MNHIQIYDNMISKESCQHIIDYFESNIDLSFSGLSGGIVNKKDKDSSDLTLRLEYPRNKDEFEINNYILKSLKKGTEKYRNKFKFLDMMIGTWHVDDRFNIQRFNEGQGYHGIHCEHSKDDCNRMLVWMIYLNNAKCGTRFYYPQRDVKAKQGRLVLWPPDWTYPHSGITPNKGKKYIATGWFSYY